MKFYTKSKLLKEIFSCKEKYKIFNIISPPFSYGSCFIEEIRLKINEIPKSLFVLHSGSNLSNVKLFESLSKSLENEKGILLSYDCIDIPLNDFLIGLLKKIDSNNLNRIFLLINDLDNKNPDEIYLLFSQLRNFREKATSHNLLISLSVICIGTWKPSVIREKCHINFGSFFPVEFYLSDLELEEIWDFINTYYTTNNFKNIDDYIIKYLFEISSGSFFVIDYILKNIDDKISCSSIRKISANLSKDSLFVSEIKNTLDSLSDFSKKVLSAILSGLIVEYNHKLIDKYEELLISGIIKVNFNADLAFLSLRSWVHEISVRSVVDLRKTLECENNLGINDLIPPTPSINQFAYEIVMEIENRLRNYIVTVLSESPGVKDNPFTVVDTIEQINNNWVKYTLSEELIHQKNKIKSEYSYLYDTTASLSSFLQITDLFSLLKQKNGKKDFSSLYKSLFYSDKKFDDLFKEFKAIRNQVAHNNIINEEAIKKLIFIRKQLFDKMKISIKAFEK